MKFENTRQGTRTYDPNQVWINLSNVNFQLKNKTKQLFQKIQRSILQIPFPISKAIIIMKDPNCIIDKKVLNEKTIYSMDDIALSFFASACGRNRGAFVLDPPNGETYSW